MKHFAQSLSGKLLLCTGGATVLVLAAAIVTAALDGKARTERSILQEADATAGAVASTFTQQIVTLSSAVDTMTSTMGAAVESGMHDRGTILAMMKAVAERYDLAFGVTVLEERGALDGKVGAELLGNNKDGDFASYWSKEKGEIAYSPVPTTRDDPWYKGPAETGKATLTEPYVYEMDGKKIVMTTVAYPIKSANRLLGIGTIDINLETLSSDVEAMRPFGEGRVMLVSGDGAWLANPDPTLRMQPYSGVGEAELKAALADGRARTLRDFKTGNATVERVIYPFAIPGLGTSWAAIVDVPVAVIDVPVRAQLQSLVFGGFLILLVLFCALYASTLLIVRRPVATLLQAVTKLRAGDFETTVVGQQRTDEIGDLSDALESFRLRLNQGRSAEIQAADERQETENLRLRSEKERETAAFEQGQVVDGLSEALTHLAAGNLAFSLSEAFPKQFDSLRVDYNRAVDQLRETLAAVAMSTNSIDTGSNEISRSAEDLSRRTEQQAASLEETAAALDEITANVAQSAKRAEDARSVAVEANESAHHSGAVVAKAIDAMGRIEQSSERISNIIGVIDEIAFQTNLLALNAGVEAARAGEAGKGFAVVAQEVRELAQRSAHAAKEIKELIRNSTAEVESGVKLVSETGKVLSSIEGHVVNINRHMEAIALSAREQSVGLSEVNTAVNQMDQVTQQNAAMVEEASAAGVGLAEEAGNLRRLVSRFSLQVVARPRLVSSDVPRPRLVAALDPAPSRVRGLTTRIGKSLNLAQSDNPKQNWEEF